MVCGLNEGMHEEHLNYSKSLVHVGSNSCPLSQWCHPTISSSVITFSSCLQFPQHQSLFQWVSSSHQVTKVLELKLQHQSSNEYSRLISFKMYCLDLLAIQGTLKSLLQHHSSKASILWCSAFFMVQLSHLYMTTRKNTPLTTCTLGKPRLFVYLPWISHLLPMLFPLWVLIVCLSYLCQFEFCHSFTSMVNHHASQKHP